MSAQLVLIASYPKSGNTWVRLILETLRRDETVSINDIGIGAYGAQRRRLFDEFAPAEASELLPYEIEEILPDIYASMESDSPIFLKVHDRMRKTPSGKWLFPPQCVKALIYVARHPLDVVMSYANHRAIPAIEAARLMGNEEHVIPSAGTSLQRSLEERPGSWSSNVLSWIDGSPYEVTLVRYEDLYADPATEFARIARAAGIVVSEGIINRAVEATRFARLQREERTNGFRERPTYSPAFFREGRPDSWIGKLEVEFCQELMRTHSQAAERLGYRLAANS